LRRRRWAKRREGWELTQREEPVAVAMRPSRVWANLTVTKGMLVQGLGELDGDEGDARGYVLEEEGVQVTAGLLEDTDDGLDAVVP